MEFDVTPEQASHGRLVKDQDLPMLAARWLTQGYDSPTLREIAGLTARQGTEARQSLSIALSELGYPVPVRDVPWDDLPWRGYWDSIWWAVDRTDKTHSPYAAAQHVIEILDDVPDLWGPGHGDELAAMLAEWDENPDRRTELDDRIRTHLRSLREDDVPSLA